MKRFTTVQYFDINMNLEIAKLGPADVDMFTELIKIFSEVFEMKDFNPPVKSHLQNTLNKPGFMAFAATIDSEIVGGMTVYILDQYYSEKPLAYLFDLAILKKYQRRRIGTELIGFLKDYCRYEGFEEIFVQADVVDDYALEFYRSTGITEEEDVRHFYYLL
jgi:aminoglycoside 3-N-acetyltransferase I